MLALAVFAACFALAAAILVFGRPHPTRTAARHAPPPLMLPDHPEADWSQAPVLRSPLTVRYSEDDASVTELVIHPRSIRGPKVGDERVRPVVVNAHCESRDGMRALRVERIVSAADARSGEFIDDLYTYLGSAQPGGAPAPSYGARSPDQGTRPKWEGGDEAA